MVNVSREEVLRTPSDVHTGMITLKRTVFALLTGILAGTSAGAVVALVFGASIGAVPVIAAGVGAGVASGFVIGRPVPSLP